MKLTVRKDDWRVDESLRDRLPNGYAVAMQLSQKFDVLELFDGARR